MPLRGTLLFAATFCAVFLWLALVPGGGRLVATDAPARQRQAEAKHPPQAATLCLPGEPQRDQGTPPGDKPGGSAPWTREAIAPGAALRMRAAPACDANGNVIRAERYALAAYRAFVLGDAGG
jgi:hypothetical protein